MTKQSVNIASEILDLRDDNFLDCRKNREIVERENNLIHTNHGITGVNKEWGKKQNGMVKSKQRKAGIAQKMKFSIKDFFSKCDQIRSFLRIWSQLLKKYLIENFLFCAV